MINSVRIAARLSSALIDSKVRPYIGASSELGGIAKTQEELPLAAILLIERSESGVLLIRYAANGRFAGDTWHPNLDEAKEQVTCEFGEEAVSAWKEIPADVSDVVAFMTSAPS